MTDPSADDPYGYFAGQPAAQQAAPAPVGSWPPPTLDPQERILLVGSRLTAEHNMGYSPSFHPVGSRLGIAGSISAGFRLLPTCWAALMAEPALLLVPLAVLGVGLLIALGYAVFGGISHLLSGGRGAVACKTLPLTAVMCAVSVVGRPWSWLVRLNECRG